MWRGLGVAGPGDAARETLVQQYQEPQRHYHTVQHLSECFAHLHAARDLAEHIAEVEVALWFHDAVYDVHASDNEERSARLAGAALVDAGVAADVSSRVYHLIMATKHDAVPTNTDARLLVDVDLAILGAEPSRYAEFERQVRAEFAWVPALIFRRKRREILRGFVTRHHIYATEHFRQRFESQARANLSRAIEALGGWFGTGIFGQ